MSPCFSLSSALVRLLLCASSYEPVYALRKPNLPHVLFDEAANVVRGVWYIACQKKRIKEIEAITPAAAAVVSLKVATEKWIHDRERCKNHHVERLNEKFSVNFSKVIAVRALQKLLFSFFHFLCSCCLGVDSPQTRAPLQKSPIRFYQCACLKPPLHLLLHRKAMLILIQSMTCFERLTQGI